MANLNLYLFVAALSLTATYVFMSIYDNSS